MPSRFGWPAKRHNAGFPWAGVLDNPLDCSVRSACVTPFENHKHLLLVLDDMFLKLDELDLEIAQRLLVSFVTVALATRLYRLRRFGLGVLRYLPLTGNGSLSEYFRAFATTFIPHDDVNQVQGSETGEETEERDVGKGQKRVDYNCNSNQRQSK